MLLNGCTDFRKTPPLFIFKKCGVKSAFQPYCMVLSCGHLTLRVCVENL